MEPICSVADVKSTSCLYRQFCAYAARDQRTQDESKAGTSDGAPYKNNKSLLPGNLAVDFYLSQFPQAKCRKKVGRSGITTCQ